MKTLRHTTTLAALVILGATTLPAQAGLLGGSAGGAGQIGGALGGGRSLDLSGSGQAAGEATLRRPEQRPLETVRPRTQAAKQAATDGVATAREQGQAQARQPVNVDAQAAAEGKAQASASASR